MLKGRDVLMIHDLHRQGLSIQEIARSTGRDRKTVRKYLKVGLEPPVYGPRRAPARDPRGTAEPRPNAQTAARQTPKSEEVYWQLYDNPGHCRDCLAEFQARYNQIRPHWALRPAPGADPLTPHEVYAEGAEIIIPKWQH